MRRWFRRLRLALASLLVLLAVGLLIAWPVTAQRTPLVAVESGPTWRGQWCAGLGVSHGRIVGAFVSADTLIIPSLESFHRIALPPLLNEWIRVYTTRDAGIEGRQNKPRFYDFTFRVDSPHAIHDTFIELALPIVYVSPILLLLAFLLAFGPIRRNLQRRYRVKSGVCLLCGYNLAGVEGTQCPECGADRTMVTFHRGEA